MVQDQWTETCASQVYSLYVYVCRSRRDCFENVAALYGRCEIVCVCMGVFSHDLSTFKAAEYLFSWSEAGVSAVLAATMFHTWLTV